MYIAQKNEGCLGRNSISFRERELQTESTTCLKTIKQKKNLTHLRPEKKYPESGV